MVRLKERWKDILYTLLGLILIAALLLRADVTDTLDILADINLNLILLVLGLYFLNTFCKVIRWVGLLKGMGAKKVGMVTLPIFLSSLALNNSTPGKVGGEPVRALMLKEHTGNRISLGLATIFVEKSLDIITILAFAGFGLVYMISVLGFDDVRGIFYAFIAGAIIIMIVILLVVSRRFMRLINRTLEKATLRFVGRKEDSRIFRIVSKLEGSLHRFHSSIRTMIRNPGIGIGVLILTLVIWLNEALRLYIIISALPGDIYIPFQGAVAGVAVANIIGMVLPIGSGNVIGSASVLELLTGKEANSTAASLTQVATSLWISIPLGLLSLVFLRKRSKELISKEIEKDGISVLPSSEDPEGSSLLGNAPRK